MASVGAIGFSEQDPASAVGAAARALHQGGLVAVDGPDYAVSVLVSDVLDLSRRKRVVVDSTLELEAAAKEAGVDYFSFQRMEDIWQRVRSVKDIVSPAELIQYLVRRCYGLYVVHGLEEELRARQTGPITFSSHTTLLLKRAVKDDGAGVLYWGRFTERLSEDKPLELVYDPPLPEVQALGHRSRPSGLS